MGERTTYAEGQFCWVDLSTPDVDGAKRFYGELLGWQYEDLPMPEGGAYSMARLDGKDVAAISQQQPAQGEAGVPPMWNNYINVADADAAAARAAEHGANVHAGPFDVMDAGRMAVVQDPQGALVMLWQPKDNIGAKIVNAPGALCWNELATGDVDGSIDFYAKLMGWETGPVEGQMEYWTIKNKGASNGGFRKVNPGEPPNWSCYFAVDEVDGGLARAKELGATQLMDIIDMGFAKFVPLRDPQGALVTLYSGMLED